MEELSIEEKARAYDKAFRIAQELYNDPNSSNVGKGYVCTVFPELQESEDERIRNEIVIYIGAKNDISLNTHNRWLSWLEKQGEQKTADKVEPKGYNTFDIPFGAKDSKLQEATYYIPKGFYSVLDGNKVIIKKGEQKPAWSDEDEVRLQACLDTLQARSIMGKVDTIMTIWLKSLKDRILPQPKQEWSEEDEEHVNSLLKRLEGLCRKEFATTRFAINEDENWLKSLRPQNN